MDGTVKTSGCKLNLVISRLSKMPLAVRCGGLRIRTRLTSPPEIGGQVLRNAPYLQYVAGGLFTKPLILDPFDYKI